MPDVSARPGDLTPTGRLLDAQSAFGRGRDETRGFYGLVGQNAALLALTRVVDRLAPHARTSLIVGPPGAGKTLLAGIAHRLGPCRGGAQVRLDGGDDAFEREQLREAARGGRGGVTCFVPEIGDLSAERQADLVRAMVASADLPLGEGLHVIAATSRQVQWDVAAGRLRPDLVSRLDAVRYCVPGLDERRDDIALLVPVLLRDACRRLRLPEKGVATAGLSLLEARPWQGHVRELQHVLQRAVALTDDLVIGAQTIAEACGPVAAPLTARRRPTLSHDDRQRVAMALADARGNKSAAAARLGVSRRALYRLLERVGA